MPGVLCQELGTPPSLNPTVSKACFWRISWKHIRTSYSFGGIANDTVNQVQWILRMQEARMQNAAISLAKIAI